MAASMIYGVLWQLLVVMAPEIARNFHFDGADVHPASAADQESGVIYDGLTIHMASGDYSVTVERVHAR